MSYYNSLDLQDIQDMIVKREKDYAELVNKTKLYRHSEIPGNLIKEIEDLDKDLRNWRLELTERRARYLAKGQWTYSETVEYASNSVLENLSTYDNQNRLAIDDGVMLYPFVGFSHLDLSEIKIEYVKHRTIPDRLVDPSEFELMDSYLDMYGDRIQKYIKQRAIVLSRREIKKSEDYYDTKVGLFQIRRPVTRIDQPLLLRVAPLNYWIVQEFNRRMIGKERDEELLGIRRDSLRDLLQSQDSIDFPCPSALHVQVSIITSDNKLVILEKNRNLSVLARNKLKWTCALEEGMVWKHDAIDGGLDFVGAVKRGAKTELQIDAFEIDNIKFYGFALEHTHLNSAIIGTMKLNIPALALVPRIKKSDDFGAGYNFVSLDDAFQDIFSKPIVDSQSWHPTARMRVMMTLKDIGKFEFSTLRDSGDSPSPAVFDYKRKPSAADAPGIPETDIISVLFVHADPSDRTHLRLTEEERVIREMIRSAKLRENFSLHTVPSARVSDFLQAFVDWKPTVVHFSGHGDVDGSICLETDIGTSHPISPDSLAEVFESFKESVSCVILNACYSEAQAIAVSEHIKYVIGISHEIEDPYAIAFTLGFYQALGGGNTIREAYENGWRMMRMKYSVPHNFKPIWHEQNT